MKRFSLPFIGLLTFVALLFAVPLIPSPAWAVVLDNAVITVAGSNDNVTSQAVALPSGSGTMGGKPISKLYIQVPTITSSTVTVTGSIDGGLTYAAIRCLNNNTNIVAATPAAGTSGMIFEYPCDMRGYDHIKIVAGSAQAATRTFGLVGVQ